MSSRVSMLRLKAFVGGESPGNIAVMRLVFYVLSIIILLVLAEQVINDPGAGGYLSLTKSLLYFLMGVVAATIANSTGAGGGIVFLPIFIGLGFSPIESLSTSIAIQCFGMSSGSLAWIAYHERERRVLPEQWRNFYLMLSVAILSSCVGIQLTLKLLPDPYLDIELVFSVFSLFVGAYILQRALRNRSESIGRSNALGAQEMLGLAMVGFIGGVVTSWISVGVGELLLIYLIAIGVRLNVAVAVAVCVSAVSVLSAIPHFMAERVVSLHVLVFAAPGALIGGFVARYIATWLGAHKLKVAASCWIILSSLPHLIFYFFK